MLPCPLLEPRTPAPFAQTMHTHVRPGYIALLFLLHIALSAAATKTTCAQHWTFRAESNDFSGMTVSKKTERVLLIMISTVSSNIWNKGKRGAQCVSVSHLESFRHHIRRSTRG